MKCSVSVDPVGCAKLRTQRKGERVCVCTKTRFIPTGREGAYCWPLVICSFFCCQRCMASGTAKTGPPSKALQLRGPGRARTPVLHSRQSEWALAEASQLWQYVWLTRVTGGPEPAKRSPTGQPRRQHDDGSSPARFVSRKGPHGLAIPQVSQASRSRVGRRSTGHELGLRRSIGYCLRCTQGGVSHGNSTNIISTLECISAYWKEKKKLAPPEGDVRCRTPGRRIFFFFLQEPRITRNTLCTNFVMTYKTIPVQ